MTCAFATAIGVKTGDVLVKLDGTVARANLAIVVKGLDELAALQARLEAERDGAGGVVFPASVESHRSETDVRKLLTGEEKLFEFRGNARAGQKSQLREHVAQLQEEIQGLTGRRAQKDEKLSLSIASWRASATCGPRIWCRFPG